MSINFNSFYKKNNSWIRTVGRAFDEKTGKSIILFCYVNKGGTASDIYFLPEEEFVMLCSTTV